MGDVPCCVCLGTKSDLGNGLVSCSGHGCKVTVHQACYGIVNLPSSGYWYCTKCTSQERTAKVKCELCPNREGAYKRTDKGGWAHVVCALYIPEVVFEDTTTMEPILTTKIPRERLSKTCYVCEEKGNESSSGYGACMTCHKQSCRLSFHVTCGQKVGLLCEEVDPRDNSCIIYCGYCETHFKKKLVLGKRKGSDKRATGDGIVRAHSLSVDSPSAVSSGTPVKPTSDFPPLKVEPQEVKPTNIKRRAKRRKLSSSSECSDTSEIGSLPIHALDKQAEVQKSPPIIEESQVLPMKPSEGESVSVKSGGVEETDSFLDPVKKDSSSSNSSTSESSETESELSVKGNDTTNELMDATTLKSKDDESFITQPFSPSLSSVASISSSVHLDEGNLVLPQAGDSARVGKEEKPILKKKIKSMEKLPCTTSISEAGARSGRKGKPGLSFRGRGGVSGVTRNKTGIVPKQTPAVKTSSASARSKPRGFDGTQTFTPQTLDDLLKAQWEQSMEFISRNSSLQPNAAALLEELAQLQEENKNMEKKIVELTSQKDFYLSTKSRLQNLLQHNLPLLSNGSHGMTSTQNVDLQSTSVVDLQGMHGDKKDFVPKETSESSRNNLMVDPVSLKMGDLHQVSHVAATYSNQHLEAWPAISQNKPMDTWPILPQAATLVGTLHYPKQDYTTPLWTTSGWTHDTSATSETNLSDS